MENFIEKHKKSINVSLVTLAASGMAYYLYRKFEVMNIIGEKRKRINSLINEGLHDSDIHIGIDIGGTQVKICLIIHFEMENVMDLTTLNREVTRIGDYQIMYYQFYTVDIEKGLLTRFKKKIMPYYKKDHIYVTGGGAVRLNKTMEKLQKVRIIEISEMASIYDGIQLNINLKTKMFYTLDYNNWEKAYIDNVNGIKFPLLVANIGTGVSFIIIRRDGFERVGGTPIGGGTYTGLCDALIGESDYAELIKLTDQGNENNVDLMLEDFYKTKLEGFGKKKEFEYSNKKKNSVDEIQLSPPKRKNTAEDMQKFLERHGTTTDKNASESCQTDNVTFVSLGVIPQLDEKQVENLDKSDIAKSLLHMITFNVTQLAYLYAKLCNMDRILFTGSFVNGRKVTQKLIMRGLRFFNEQVGYCTKAFFSDYDGFFGAMACIKKDLDECEDHKIHSQLLVDYSESETYSNVKF